VSTVNVSNDAAGTYSFDVAFAAPLTRTSFIDVYLDTDLNPATGDPGAVGADDVIVDDQANQNYDFYKWDGLQWNVAKPIAIHVIGSTDQKDLKFVVGKPDIGTVPGFNFFVESVEGDGSAGHFDVAPEGVAVWQYMLQPQQQVTLSLLAAKETAVKAGGTWVLALAAKRSDTGATLGKEGTIVCHATSGSTKLVGAGHGFVSAGSSGSAAVCSFKVPKKLRHKVLHGAITVSYEGGSVTHSFATKVG
jgi:hypothetical protein